MSTTPRRAYELASSALDLFAERHPEVDIHLYGEDISRPPFPATRHGVLTPETQGLIEQGLEAQRPSAIYVRASKAGDHVSNVRVGGNVVHVINGEVTM